MIYVITMIKIFPPLKLLLLATTSLCFICSTASADTEDNAFDASILGTKIGIEANFQNIPEKKIKYIKCLDIVKNAKGTYDVLGVMSFPGKDVYVWKGTGVAKDGNLVIEYYGIVGESEGDAKLYFTKEVGWRFLFDDTVFELNETP